MKTVESQVGLFLGVPTLGRPVPIQWAFSYASLRPPINYNVRTGVIWGKKVADARNELAKQAIEHNCRYLFFLGDDVTGPGHGLRHLIYRMEHDDKLGVVGGIYCSKSEPPSPLVFRGNGAGCFWDWKLGEYFEVTGIGMDFTLIRVELLKELEPPWFETVATDKYLDGESDCETWTEDLWFCKRVLENTDYHIYADSIVMCNHWNHVSGNVWQQFGLPASSKPMCQEEISGKQILDLGCGPVHYDFGSEGQVTRCDAREDCNPDYRIDVSQLPFADNSYDVVFSSHVLEHFGRLEVNEVIQEWLRVLKPDGEFRIIVPNIKWAAQKIQDNIVDDDVLNVLYGSQEYHLNFHKNGFTPERLIEVLDCNGLEVTDNFEEGYNIFIKAKFREMKAMEPKKHIAGEDDIPQDSLPVMSSIEDFG